MTDTTIVFLWLSGMLCGYSIGFLVARAIYRSKTWPR